MCYDGDQIAGAISFYANDERSHRAYITQLMVAPAFQRKGIGTELLRECERYLGSTDMEYVALEVLKTNAGARRLYERMGFCIYDESNGSYYMEKHLGYRVEGIQ